MIEKITQHLSQYNPDVRKTNDARFRDQKCTPDVVCIITDYIINIRESSPIQEFVVQDIWGSSHYLENLIKLTPTQHFTKAHLNNKTDKINIDYQLVCLLSKSDSIEKSLNKGEFIYSIESFVFCINTGLKQELASSLNFQDIKMQLVHIYNNM